MADEHRTKHGDAALEALLDAAREDGPGDELMARVLADAVQVQAVAAAPVPVDPARAARGTWLGELIGALGGWGAVSGITAAGVVGLVVGLYSPDTIGGFLDGTPIILGIGGYDVAPDLGALWTESGDV